MIKLYFAPRARTRSIRVRWLLEELGIPYQLELIDFKPSPTPFGQNTPSGKFPVIEDGELVMSESGAIVQYLLEQYGEGRLGPRPGEPGRAVFLQWLHFAEATLMPPVIELLRETRLKPEAARSPAMAAEAKVRVTHTLAVVERALKDHPYITGTEFSAADIMMGYGMVMVEQFGLLADSATLQGYFQRLTTRPTFAKALTV